MITKSSAWAAPGILISWGNICFTGWGDFSQTKASKIGYFTAIDSSSVQTIADRQRLVVA